MLPRLIAVISALLALALAGTAAAAPPVFKISGRGWGHAVGMAQYGALGFAENGWTYDQVLAHYYPGTELTTVPAQKVRVLLAEGRGSVEISSTEPFTVVDAAGTVVQLPAGDVTVGKDFTIDVDGTPTELEAPLRFKPGAAALVFGSPYRGQLIVHLAGGKLTVVNQLGIERYVQGVVASEMESTWHPEALRAQAVATRSYALVSKKTSGLYDLYSDTRSQVYGGIDAEAKTTNAAVKATVRQVLTFEGKVAWTFFSASSGGRTAAVEDAWAGAEPMPYLVSVEDPFDDLSPYHRWGPLTFTVDDLEARLGSRIPDGLEELRVVKNASGRVAKVVAVGAGGAQKEISGSTMRTLLGLRSTWFRIDAVQPPA